jgi:hypothetical protein
MLFLFSTFLSVANKLCELFFGNIFWHSSDLFRYQENVCNSIRVLASLVDESQHPPDVGPEVKPLTLSKPQDQSNSEILSLDILSPTAAFGRQKKSQSVVLAPLVRYPSSGVICSASVPLSPPYVSRLESHDDMMENCEEKQTSTIRQSNSLSTKFEGTNATQQDIHHTPFSQLPQSQLTFQTQSSEFIPETLKSDRIDPPSQFETCPSLPYRHFIPDTYHAAESSFIDGDEDSQLSARLTLSQSHPISNTSIANEETHLKPSITMVSDTYHEEDQMTLDIDVSDNDELHDLDSESSLSDEINYYTARSHDPMKKDIVGNERVSPLIEDPQGTNERSPPEETMALVPQTQTIFSLDTDDIPRIVLDTYEDIPSPITSPSREMTVPAMVPNTIETNQYELSSSEDDNAHYLQYSSKKKSPDLQKVPPIPEHVVVDLVSDTMSSVAVSCLDGTLVSGTIQRSATLVDDVEDSLLLSEEEEHELGPSLGLLQGAPESTAQSSKPLPISIHFSPTVSQPLLPQRELEHNDDYNVLSYSSQNGDRPEMGGYLYGAGTDGAARRFTPHIAAVTKHLKMVSPLPPSKPFETKLFEEHESDRNQDYDVLSYSTQNGVDRPEIGGFLYGAGIDSAARRFTPQKASPPTHEPKSRDSEFGITRNDYYPENLNQAALSKPDSSHPSPSIRHNGQRNITIPTSVQKELEHNDDYNVLSYSSQNEVDRPEIGGFLYGAGIDSAARRFTPQKASPQAVGMKPQELVSPLPPSKLFESKIDSHKVDVSSESYETQDSLPTRFSWANNVTTPNKMTNDSRDPVLINHAMPGPQTPTRSSHRYNDPDETNSNDEIASWGESVSLRLFFFPNFISSLIACMILRK